MDPKKSKKKPELQEQLFVGNYIDVFHTSSKQYRLAYIISKNDKEIEVTYDGLAKKDNEVFKQQQCNRQLNYNQISYIWQEDVHKVMNHLNNQDYTGEDYKGMKTQRDYLKYSREDQEKYTKELNTIMQSNFLGMSPMDICQSIRVRQFIWLDMILSSEFPQKELSFVLEYIKTYYNFIKWYFEQFPKYFADYLRIQTNLELYLIEERASIAACFTEVCEAFCMLFGSIWRVLKPENSFFYLNFENLQGVFEKVFPVPVYQGFVPSPNLNDWKLYTGAVDLQKCIKKSWPLYLKTMSYFKSIGGISAWEGLLKSYDQGEYNYLPLKAMPKLTLVQQYFSQYFPPQEQAIMAKKTFEWLQMRITNMTVQDIKDTDIDIVREVTTDMEYYFLKGYTQEQVSRLMDEQQLQLALKFLKSTFLEKRVKGISEIKEYTEKTKTEPLGQMKIRNTINKEELLKWICQHKILDYTLLGDSVHPELIKRSSDVAIFLCKNTAFNNDQIDKIWTQNFDKHETTQLALYEFFKAISPYLNFQGIEKLYTHISNIPYAKYNENVVSMVKTFTEAALSQKFHEMQLQIAPEKRFMTFNQLWELLLDRDDQLAGSHIQESCFQAARQIVSQIPQTKQFISQYCGKCFELIGSHKSVYQAISFVHYILDKQFRDDPMGKKNLIKQTDIKYNIIELFVKDMEVYMEKIRQHFKGEAPQDIIVSGVQTFQQNVFFRLQMLNYLLSQSDLRITYEQIVRLWETLCAKTKGSIQKREFNKIIIQTPQDNSFTKINQVYFEREAEQKFFISILCNQEANDFENYTIEDFELFQLFFKSYNSQKQTLRYFGHSYNSRFLVQDFNFEGKVAIWQIFAKVKDPLLIDLISNFIIGLHTQLSITLEMKSDKIQQEMMDKCLELIQYQCPGLTSRSINLLLQLFNFFQNGPASKKPLKPLNYTQFKAQIFLPNNTIKQMDFKEGDTSTIHIWKQKLAEELCCAYQQLDVTLENKPIEQSYDVTETSVSQVFFQLAQVKVKINNKFHPKNYLSQESRTFEILFKLLEKQESVEFLAQVWDLINRLPVNAAVKKSVENCKEWKQYLDHSFFDMFYVLQIIYKLLENPQWSEEFTNSDGVDLVTQKFLGQNLDFFSHPLEKKCCLTYLDILSHPSIKISEPQLIQQIKKKTLEIISQLCQDIKTRKKPDSIQKKSPAQKEMNEVESKLLRVSFNQLGNEGSRQYIRGPQLSSQLCTFFIEHENHELKREYGAQLLILKNTIESRLLLKSLLEEVLKIVVSSNKQKCDQFFEFSCNLLLLEQNLDLQLLNLEELLTFIRSNLIRLPINENTLKDQDQILIGLLKLLNVLVEKFPNLGNNPGLFQEILGYLLENEGEVRCKCKSQQSRTAAFNCFFSLLKVPQNMEKFLDIIPPLHQTSVWRTKHLNDWNIQSKFHEKSSTGFVGLYNLGCICYMNSLLQQLFMIPSFREKLLQIEDKNQGPPEENLLHQAKCLFLALKHSQKQYHNPKKFCHAFKDLDGNPTNIFEQMDVDEFCNLLMDRIEANIKSTSDEDLVKRNFGGMMSNEIIGKTCPHYSEREEPFFAVSLPVANKKNLEDCLQSLVHGDLLEGDNAYKCEQCNKKVSALKRMCIKKLPDHLILVLKRFNFDFDLMAKAKINDRIEFPFELDLEPYSQQGLRKLEKREGDSSQDNPSEYYQYRLTGAVIHLGSADSGHYYSFIQDRNDLLKWYEFNDINVSHADMKDLKNDGFGGIDKLLKNKYPPQFKDKSKSAYMLFYERINPLNIQNQGMEIEPNQNTIQFLDEIKEENRKFQIQRFIFSSEYFNFMQNMIRWQLQSKDTSDQIIKTLVFFFLTCAVRENDKSFISNNIVDLIELMKRSLPTCEWLLKCFIQPHYIREFQFDCSKKMVRKFIISMLIAAIATVQQQEGYKVLFEEAAEIPKSLVANLINQWILTISELKKSLKNSIEFYDLFYKFAKLSKQNAQYLLSKKLVGKLLDLAFDILQINPNKSLIQQRELVKKVDDIKVLQIMEDQTSYLGLQNTQNIDAASNYYDDLLEKKFEKSMNQGPATSRVYLWRVIAYLLKTEGKLAVSVEEQALLAFDQQSVLLILEEGDCKLAIRMVTDILSQLSIDNQKQSDTIISAIIKQINDKEYKEYRKYIVPLKKLFLIKDQLQQNRIHNGMMKLLEAMFKQCQFFFETDVCQQYILRMSFKNQALYQWMVKNQRSWQWMLESTNSSQQNPNEKLIQNNSNPTKCQHRLHNIYLPTTCQAYQKVIGWKKLQLLNLTKEPYKQSEEFDSDDDLTEKVVKVDDKIDYYDSNQWITATVSKVMCDYISLTFSGRLAPQNTDIELDNERLAPFNTLSNNNKIPGYTNNYEMVIEHQSDHENDTEEGNNNSNNQTDSDEE